MHYSLVVEDEYGVPYAARIFSSIEEIWEEIHDLDAALEHVGKGQSYAILAAIDQLKQLIHEAEEEPETILDRPAF